MTFIVFWTIVIIILLFLLTMVFSKISKNVSSERLKEPRNTENHNGRAKDHKEIEDVRSSIDEEGELILNLWYVTDMIVISSLRSKIYVASGTDADKQSFLKMRAKHDFKDALVFSVPESLKANVTNVDGTSFGNVCTHDTLDFMGGYPALFSDFILSIPKTYNFNPSQAMMCITALEEDKDGNMSARTDD